MKRSGSCTTTAATLLLAIPGARADNIPQWLNPIWEFIWTLFCFIPFIGWACTTCEFVAVNSNNSDGGACRMRLTDNTTSPALDVLLEAKEGPTAGAYVVQEILPIGDNVSTTPKIVTVERTGTNVVIDPNGVLTVNNGTNSPSEASCAHILLSYDWNEGEKFPAGGKPYMETVEGYGCTEFGATLLWYMVVESFPFYKN
jgi:hypothetical protein